jgi:PEP-CTERM motif-containing protein
MFRDRIPARSVISSFAPAAWQLRIDCRQAIAAVGLVLVGLSVSPGRLSALPLNTVNPDNSHNFRDRRSLNDVGLLQGSVNQFGVDINPPGSSGTSLLSAVQGSVVVGPRLCVGLSVDANFCGQTIPFNPSLGAEWTLTFANGADRLTTTTPALGAPPGSPEVPFPERVTISGSDAIRVVVFDKTAPLLANGMRDVVHVQALGGDARQFTVPTLLSSGQSLKQGNNYSMMIQLVQTRGHGPLVGTSLGAVADRSSSFFDFTVLDRGAPPQVLLPTVGPAPDPGTGFGPTYHFTTPVVPNELVFIDPLVAIGYKYATGVGDPNFASVVLPEVGDNLYNLSFSTGQNLMQLILGANTQFFFPGGGVSAFDVTGIEASAMLDPQNVTAFVTGLTFVSQGNFTGTMTPLLAPTPEPTTMLLFGLTAGGLGWLRLRSRRPTGEPTGE